LNGEPLAKPEIKPKAGQPLTLAANSGRSRPGPGSRWDDCATWVYHGLRLALAGVFIYAGLIKLLEPRAFAHAIAQYGLVPEGLLPLVAVGLPALELLAGLGLMLEVRGSLTVIIILLFIFLAALGYAIRENLDIDCGCFTVAELEGIYSIKTAFWRDVLMIGVTFFLSRRRRSRPTQNLWIRKLTTRIKGESQ
jgi:uncharacterized membrane protein YphA (DoxX/SURF4 family)